MPTNSQHKRRRELVREKWARGKRKLMDGPNHVGNTPLCLARKVWLYLSWDLGWTDVASAVARL